MLGYSDDVCGTLTTTRSAQVNGRLWVPSAVQASLALSRFPGYRHYPRIQQTPETLKSLHAGFVADVRRMNVAITRARRALWVLGNAVTLLQSPVWAALLRDADARGFIIPNASARYLGFFRFCAQSNQVEFNVRGETFDEIW